MEVVVWFVIGRIGYTIFVLPDGWRNAQLPLGGILAHMILKFSFCDWHLFSENSVARQTQLLKCLWETSGDMWMWSQQIHFKKCKPMFTGGKMEPFCIIWLECYKLIWFSLFFCHRIFMTMLCVYTYIYISTLGITNPVVPGKIFNHLDHESHECLRQKLRH